MFVLQRPPISTIKWDVSAITYEVNMVIFYYCYLSPGLKACVLYTQRRKWLREVFASQSENSPVKRLVGNMQVLHVPCDSEEDVQRHTDLLDETLSLCEDIDLAMGEHSVLPILISVGLLLIIYSHMIPLFFLWFPFWRGEAGLVVTSCSSAVWLLSKIIPLVTVVGLFPLLFYFLCLS